MAGQLKVAVMAITAKGIGAIQGAMGDLRHHRLHPGREVA